MPQAARAVSRVFLDGVASVISGTASTKLGYVTLPGTARPASLPWLSPPGGELGRFPLNISREKRSLSALNRGWTRHEPSRDGLRPLPERG
jgi:hypothetical protein